MGYTKSDEGKTWNIEYVANYIKSIIYVLCILKDLKDKFFEWFIFIVYKKAEH